MRNYIIFLLILIGNLNKCQVSDKTFPLYLDPIPNEIEIKYVGHQILFSPLEIETEIYSIEFPNILAYLLKTDQLPDCICIIGNRYGLGGADLYVKQKEGNYRHIFEIRDLKTEFGIYKVNRENITSLILKITKEKEDDDIPFIPVMHAYSLAWYSKIRELYPQ